MQIAFYDVFIAVLALLLLTIPGFVLGKFKLVPENASGTISDYILYVAQAVMVFMSFQDIPFKPEIALNMLTIIGLVFVVYVIMVIICYVFIRGKDDESKKCCVRYASIFSNCGFMGIPFLQALFPNNSEVLIYAGAIVAVFNVVNWTLGVYLMCGNKKEISIKKIVCNPVIISVVLALAMFFFIQKPLYDVAPQGSRLDSALTKILNSLNTIGDTVTPLSMTVIGLKLSQVSLKELFLDKWAYVTAFLKLVVMSLVSIFVVAFLPVSIVVKYVLFFLMSMPPAASTAMFAVRFNKDSKAASVYVLLGTILSIASISLMFLLFNAIVG